MPLPIRSLVPFAHVRDVDTALTFYKQLGFEIGNTFIPDGRSKPSWGWLQSGPSQLMVALADEPVVPSQQAILFYLYVDDVAAKRAELQGEGVACGPIEYPFYAERGEFRLTDPDGYVLMITHT
ncbi:MAG: hypothetical protein JWN02_1496 [Acidobacteria bacterium]|nr:hypothetical protein [Acidobacteriota bacterium]